MYTLNALRITALCITSVVALGLALLTGCQSSGQEPSTKTAPVQAVESPVGPESGQPHLYVGAGGTLWMSWVEPMDSARHTLRYASFDGEAWSAVQTAAAGTDWFVNWADVPSLRPLPDGGMAAHYLKSSGASVYAYDVRIAQTDEGGAWQEAITPHDDGTPTEHGFVSLLQWEGDLLAVWLDGRNMLAAEGEEGGPMTLRAGLVTPSGEVTRPALLDDRTCECCNTAAVHTEAGVLVAYRDRTPDEVRDIYLTRFDGQRWSAPQLLHDDGWKISGCPVNGPALAAQGRRVAAAWFTGAEGVPRVNVAFSDDGGQQFRAPISVDEGSSVGRVDVALLDDGSALVSWLDTEGDPAAIRTRHIHPDGTMGAPIRLAEVSAARRSGMPRLVRTGTQVYLAWVDAEAGQVQLTRAEVEALR